MGFFNPGFFLGRVFPQPKPHFWIIWFFFPPPDPIFSHYLPHFFFPGASASKNRGEIFFSGFPKGGQGNRDGKLKSRGGKNLVFRFFSGGGMIWGGQKPAPRPGAGFNGFTGGPKIWANSPIKEKGGGGARSPPGGGGQAGPEKKGAGRGETLGALKGGGGPPNAKAGERGAPDFF